MKKNSLSSIMKGVKKMKEGGVNEGKPVIKGIKQAAANAAREKSGRIFDPAPLNVETLPEVVIKSPRVQTLPPVTIKAKAKPGFHKAGGSVGKSKKMAMGGTLKPVDASKNPGLSKLPTAVRNKMGYKKYGGSKMKMGGMVKGKKC